MSNETLANTQKTMPMTMPMTTPKTMDVHDIRSLVTETRALQVLWADGTVSTFHYLWLRDNCPQLLHATTRHRVAETSDLPDDLHPSAVSINDRGQIEIVWSHDAHASTFDATWLRNNDYSNGARYTRPSISLWDASLGDRTPTASYPALYHDPAIRRSFLEGFLAHGLGVLKDVPCEPGTVLEVAQQLGELRTTSWGLVFDVISMEDANSVAYTNLPLVTHTDEGYRDPAPTVQLQHFLRADAQGGASTLVDGFKVAEDLRVEAPKHFELLSTTMLDFHFADATAEHHATAPIISLNPDGSIRAIRYSNHSVLPFLLPAQTMEAFYAAYRAYGRMRESSKYKLELKLGAGDLYIVDNHRVMHGRTGFSSGGARHLQSCYIERDELVSRLTVLQRG
jgi:gamma-butyrobetaine hydroxylase